MILCTDYSVCATSDLCPKSSQLLIDAGIYQIYLFIYLFIHLFIHFFYFSPQGLLLIDAGIYQIYLFIYLFIHLFIHFFYFSPQGLFLQRQVEVSKEFAAFMTAELLTPKKIWDEITYGKYVLWLILIEIDYYMYIPYFQPLYVALSYIYVISKCYHHHSL